MKVRTRRAPRVAVARWTVVRLVLALAGAGAVWVGASRRDGLVVAAGLAALYSSISLLKGAR